MGVPKTMIGQSASECIRHGPSSKLTLSCPRKGLAVHGQARPHHTREDLYYSV